MRRLFLPVLSIAGLLTSLACGGLVEKGVEMAVEEGLEKGLGVEIDEEGNSVTVKGDDGSTVTLGQIDPPDDLPVTVPSDAEIQGGLTGTGADASKAGVFAFTSKEAAEGLADGYASELEGKGFEVTRTTMNGDGAKIITVAGQKEGQPGVVVAVTRPDDEPHTVVSIQWASPQQAEKAP